MGNQSSSILFNIVADKSEAQKLLDKAEQKDFYLEECNDDQINSLARKNLSYSANGMTGQDYTFFKVVIDNSKGKIPIRLENDLKYINLVQLMPSADGGMPHTRPDNVICYPDITKTFSYKTLIHELWHIHQRLYVSEWESVFGHIGWEPWTGKLPSRLEMARRFNPDTIDSPLWCYQKTWVPVPIFRDLTRPDVTEVDIWFYHVSLKYHVKSTPKEMENVYGELSWSAYEHPREIAAYLLSDPDRYGNCSGFHELVRVIGATALPRQ
jgi:hypothetical protein